MKRVGSQSWHQQTLTHPWWMGQSYISVSDSCDFPRDFLALFHSEIYECHFVPVYFSLLNHEHLAEVSEAWGSFHVVLFLLSPPGHVSDTGLESFGRPVTPGKTAALLSSLIIVVTVVRWRLGHDIDDFVSDPLVSFFRSQHKVLLWDVLTFT